MVQPSTVQKLQQTETEVAVLQTQFGFINEKVDDIKTDLQNLTDHINDQTESTQNLIREFQEENQKQHDEVNAKVASLEKWRWMIMGAGLVIGAVFWPIVGDLISFQS